MAIKVFSWQRTRMPCPLWSLRSCAQVQGVPDLACCDRDTDPAAEKEKLQSLEQKGHCVYWPSRNRV